MRWFKHDSNANADSKLQNVLLDYGLEGYGLYWYCIELIAGKVDADNITFSLEHDARIIARNTGSTAQKVEEMMRYFVRVGLFESAGGLITCMKMARRLDQSMTSNPAMRAIINGLKAKDGLVVAKPVASESENHDCGMTNSDEVMQDQIRLDQIRDKHLSAEADDMAVNGECKKINVVPHKEVIALYSKHLPMLSQPKVWNERRKKALKARWLSGITHESHGGINSLDWWDAYFEYVATCPHLLGQNDREWQADLEWLINEANLIKVIEGRYRK